MNKKQSILSLFVMGIVILTCILNSCPSLDPREINIKHGYTNIPSGGSYEFESEVADGNEGIYYSEYVEFTIENLGTADLNINSISITGDNSDDFDLDDSGMSNVISPLDSTTFSIRFDPITEGSKSAEVVIESNDADEGEYTFTVTGEGVGLAPDINVKQGTTNIPDGTGSYNFGIILVDESLEVEFTIENTGNTDLEITDISLTGDTVNFQLNDMPSSLVDPGSYTTFSIIFNPITGGGKSAIVTIENDDPDPVEQAYTFTATGNGILEGAQWAMSVITGTGESRFNGVATDAGGNIYAAGYINGTGTFSFGNSIAATGTYTGSNIVLVKYNSNGQAQWARTVTAGTGESKFNSVATDASGNIYAAGLINGTGTYNFGNSIATAGTYTGLNIVLVKYNSNGQAQWARTVTGTNVSQFRSVATDAGGNIYAAGYINGTGTFSFGNSITAAGTYTGSNILLVKYNSNGQAQWARSVTAGASSSQYYSIATDAIGNIYAAGLINGTGTYNFGNSITATGTYTGPNIILVKYNSNGDAQWARSVYTGNLMSGFSSVATDTGGNIYAAGFIYGTETYNFGNGRTATGTFTSSNILLVKYNSDGQAQWARTVTAGTNISTFSSVATDADGNIYAAGYIFGSEPFDFDTSITATGAYTDSNIVLVKYNSNDDAQWARTVTVGANDSCFWGIATDTSGNIYAAGYIVGIAGFSFDNSITTAGDYNGDNIVLVKYY